MKTAPLASVKLPPLKVAFTELLTVRPSSRLLPRVSVPPLAVKSPLPLSVPPVQLSVPDVKVAAPPPCNVPANVRLAPKDDAAAKSSVAPLKILSGSVLVTERTACVPLGILTRVPSGRTTSSLEFGTRLKLQLPEFSQLWSPLKSFQVLVALRLATTSERLVALYVGVNVAENDGVMEVKLPVLLAYVTGWIVSLTAGV